MTKCLGNWRMHCEGCINKHYGHMFCTHNVIIHHIVHLLYISSVHTVSGYMALYRIHVL